MNFLLGRMYFTSDHGYQKLVVFVPILDSNRKVTNTGRSSEKIKPFDISLEPTMCNLGNIRVKLKFNCSALLKKRFSSLYGNFILNLHTVYELNT